MSILTLKNARLCVRQDKGGGLFSVLDSNNQYEWKIHGPELLLHFWNVGEERPGIIPANKENACEIRWRKGAGRLLGVYEWKRLGIRIEMICRLHNGYLEVSIPFSRISETNTTCWRLMSLDVLPDFGAAKRGADGYMLLPNFCGGICGFNKTETHENRSHIYMLQREWEQVGAFPVFGMKQGDKAAFAGMVTSGEFDTEIVTRLNIGGKPYHTIHPCMNFREGKADPMDTVDRQVRYYFLSGNQADYVGMAKTYRKYLLEEKGAVPLRERVKTNPALAYEVTAHSFKIFHAMKRRKLAGHGKYILFTTFEQAGKVIDKIKAMGVEHASYQLTGWNQDGHDGMFPRRFPVDQRLGGEKKLRNLIKHANSIGHRIGVHDNYVDASKVSSDWDDNKVMLDRDGELVRGGVWGGGMVYFVCSHESLKVAGRDMPKMKKLGLNGMYYLDAMPRPLRLCFNKRHGHFLGRRADAEGIIKLLQFARRTMHPLPIGCENVMGYTLPHQDYAAHIFSHIPPNFRHTEAASHFIDRLVPFLHIVTHGIIKYHLTDLTGLSGSFGSVEKGILKEIEFGATPRWEWVYRDCQPKAEVLHMGQHGRFLPAMATQHQILCKELGELQYEFIEGHCQLGAGISQTTYSNGVSVIVNTERKIYKVISPGEKDGNERSISEMLKNFTSRAKQVCSTKET